TANSSVRPGGSDSHERTLDFAYRVGGRDRSQSADAREGSWRPDCNDTPRYLRFPSSDALRASVWSIRRRRVRRFPYVGNWRHAPVVGLSARTALVGLASAVRQD